MPAQGHVKYITLDDTELEIVVVWESNIEERIHADAESLQAARMRMAAAEVVAGHLDHLRQDGYIIGEPPPGPTD